MFSIWCKVSGGITGTREAPLKENGEVFLTDDYDEAIIKAANLNEKMNRDSAVNFQYTVINAGVL